LLDAKDQSQVLVPTVDLLCTPNPPQLGMVIRSICPIPGKEGQGKEGTAVALTVLFGPIGLIKHGKNVDIKEGTPLMAYTDEHFELPIK
jgi:hypothetical protein